MKSSSDLSSRMRKKRNIEEYLSQLSMLSGQQVLTSDLSELDEVFEVKQRSVKIAEEDQNQFEIPLGELSSERFQKYIATLRVANSSPVIIWLHATNDCGFIVLSNIEAFNFQFSAEDFPRGIIVLLSEDCNDKMILDFDLKNVEIEAVGRHWSLVRY